MQSLSNPPTLEMPFAEQGDKNTIPVQATGTNGASLTEGFPEITMKPRDQGGLPPSGRDMNGLGYLLSSLYFHLQNGGQFTFNSDVSTAIGGYPLGAILSYTDTNTGLVYLVRSLIANNTYDFNSDPSYIDDVHWTKAYSEDLQNYVTLNTAQTIDNNKTFKERVSVSKNGTSHCQYIMRSDYAKGTSPTANEYFEILAQDNDTSTDSTSHRLGGIAVSHLTDNSNQVEIRAYRGTSGSTTSSAIYVKVASDGTVTTSAPSVTNANGIVTQTVVTKSGNSCLKFGSGFLLQSGNSASTSSATRNITFPQPFTSTNYRIVFNFRGSSGELYAGASTSRTTTGISIKTSGGANSDALDWFAFGY